MTEGAPAIEGVLAELRAMGSAENVAGMRRFGIRGEVIYGVSVTQLRALAGRIGRDHELAQALWASGVHEARELATLVDQPEKVSEEQMERWVADLDSWDVCDACCGNLFDRTPFAWAKAGEWSAREEEFVKRAAFALMAYLAYHDKKAPDEAFLRLLPLIEAASDDGRNFVKKAVNWALRQTGKRNARLNEAAIETAERIRARGSSAARWIASDALRELRSEAVRARLARGRTIRSP